MFKEYKDKIGGKVGELYNDNKRVVNTALCFGGAIVGAKLVYDIFYNPNAAEFYECKPFFEYTRNTLSFYMKHNTPNLNEGVQIAKNTLLTMKDMGCKQSAELMDMLEASKDMSFQSQQFHVKNIKDVIPGDLATYHNYDKYQWAEIISRIVLGVTLFATGGVLGIKNLLDE